MVGEGESFMMTGKGAHRLEVIGRIAAKRLSQKDGAAELGCSARQLRRYMGRVKDAGPRGAVPARRGGARNCHPPLVKDVVLSLVREKYADFGPTFAAEKLAESDGIVVSKETLRRWMVAAELWIPRKQRRTIHQPRNRRDCLGELVQIDGSHHAWFEARAPKCCLIVFIDDATGN